MDNNSNEFSLKRLQEDPNYAEETKGIEFGVNKNNVATKYLLWAGIFSFILTILGTIFKFFFKV